jgi:hypothetical protein
MENMTGVLKGMRIAMDYQGKLLHPLGYQLIVRACLTLKAIDFFPDVTVDNVATIISYPFLTASLTDGF